MNDLQTLQVIMTMGQSNFQKTHGLNDLFIVISASYLTLKVKMRTVYLILAGLLQNKTYMDKYS